MADQTPYYRWLGVEATFWTVQTLSTSILITFGLTISKPWTSPYGSLHFHGWQMHAQSLVLHTSSTSRYECSRCFPSVRFSSNGCQRNANKRRRAPISGVSASSCSQQVADKIARYIKPNPNNIAWCDPDGQHVVWTIYFRWRICIVKPIFQVIPVNGWNMDLYRVMSAAENSPLNMTLPALGESAWQCYSAFSPSNATISPFTPPELSRWDFITAVPDLTAPCTWAIPVCDYDTWSQTAGNS